MAQHGTQGPVTVQFPGQFPGSRQGTNDGRAPWSNRSPLALRGVGAALPGEPVTTDTLIARISDGFAPDIAGRARVYADKLGIRARHLARDFHTRREGPRAGDSNPDLAARAVRAALDSAGLDVGDIGYLIGHTATPAQPVPGNIAFVADLLDFHGPHMELRQACTGFANALVIAHGLLQGQGPGAEPGPEQGIGPVVIVGSETGSSFFDPGALDEDRGQLVNMVQMGDGAAAVVLDRVDGQPGSVNGPALGSDSGPGPALGTVESSFFGQIGVGRTPGFQLADGGSARPAPRGAVLAFDHAFADVRANGADLFQAGLKAAADLGVDIDGVTHIVPHQANGIMDGLIEQFFGLPRDRIHVEADRRGNTGSAAIWLALSSLAPGMAPGETALILGAEATKYMYGGFVFRRGPHADKTAV